MWPSSAWSRPIRCGSSRNIAAQVFVRSFGYKGKHSELKIVAVGADGKPDAVLARTPIILEDGLASYSLDFESGDQDRHIEARIDPQPGEVSASNNAFGADLAIDHTKIRVLYLEGATDTSSRSALPPGRRRSGPRGLLAAAGSTDGRPGYRVHGRRCPAGPGAISRCWSYRRPRARAPRNPFGIVRLRRDHPEQCPPRCLERSAPCLDRRLDRPARGRAVHGRRAQ